MRKVNLQEAFGRFDAHWTPHVVGRLNGQEVKLAKVEGPFVWHRHEEADELFLVVRGQLHLEMRHGTVTLEEGEFFVMPRGMEHRPVADEEAWILLFEPAGTVNTGDAGGPLTVDPLDLL